MDTIKLLKIPALKLRRPGYSQPHTDYIMCQFTGLKDKKRDRNGFKNAERI
jgi:hypothetical protein